ncbi:hypothetical protein C8F01DRAFT_1174035 [Mycena amicta]|nr:hypothetical protein C8F01DRAFT_1174035 [Mycena amicta]
MGNPLSDTYGVWLIALFFQSILYGMGLLQVYLYFLWYQKDTWWQKASVILITVLESLQAGMFFTATYQVLIKGFGNFEELPLVPWSAMVQLEALYISTCVAQLFFAVFIYQLRPRDRLYPLVTVLLSLAALGAGTAQIGLIAQLKLYTELAKTSAATNTQAALAFVCDVLITVGLWWRLKSSKTSIQSTNRLLNFLITTAINRGVLTMLTALLNIILFLTKPGTFDFMSVILISGKLYMNSMLAMLNTRHHARQLAGIGIIDMDRTRPDHISMPTWNSRHGTETHQTTVEIEMISSKEPSKAKGSIRIPVAL